MAACGAHTGARRLELPDAELWWWPQWLPGARADALLAELGAAIAWQQHRVRVFGREHPAPRLSCWIGDPGARYRYAGSRFEPHPWPPSLQALRASLAAACGEHFNSVLANLYRDGSDAMGWHSDDERELGPQPRIASLSLGAPRRFRLRHRRDPALGLDLELGHGSLLLMAGATQEHYRHAVPRSRRVAAARLNLTFRRIVPADVPR